MFLKTRLTYWVSVVTIGMCASLAHASQNSHDTCTPKDMEKYLNLMSKRDVQLANRDANMAQALQNELDKMRACEQQFKTGMRGEREKFKKSVSK